MRARGLLALLIVLGLLGAGGYYARRRLTAATAPAGPVYATATVTRGPLVADVLGFGPLQPDNLASLEAPTSGTVQQVLVTQGQIVHKGQVLAILSNPNIANTVADDQLQLQKDLQALATAVGTTPPRAMATASAAAGVPVAAPQAGRVVQWRVAVGASVDAGAELAQIVDDADVVVNVGLVPYDAQQARVGDAVSVRFDNFSGEVSGTLTSIAANPTPGATSFTYPAVITLHNPGLLAPGMKGTAVIAAPGGELALPSEVTISGYGQSTVINSPLAGTVESETVAADSWVTAGQTICVLGGAAAEQSIQQLQATVSGDQAQLQQDEQTEADLTVTSDLDGTVGSVFMQPGEHVGQNQPLGTVFNASSMTLTIQVDELQVASVHPGQQVVITTPGLPGKTFSGQVTSVDPMGNTAGGAGSLATFGVSISVGAAAGLLPGMTADAQIVVQTIPDAVLVPVEAILQQGTQAEVEVLRDGRPAVVPVSVGLINNEVAQITSGLTPGQTVITGMSGAPAPTLGETGTASPTAVGSGTTAAGGAVAGGKGLRAAPTGIGARLG